MTWNHSKLLELVAVDYPWFLSSFQALPPGMLQAQSARSLVLHKYGGLCLDFDVQCYQSLQGTLGDVDLVFQVGPSTSICAQSWHPCCSAQFCQRCDHVPMQVQLQRYDMSLHRAL